MELVGQSPRKSFLKMADSPRKGNFLLFLPCLLLPAWNGNVTAGVPAAILYLKVDMEKGDHTLRVTEEKKKKELTYLVMTLMSHT